MPDVGLTPGRYVSIMVRTTDAAWTNRRAKIFDPLFRQNSPDGGSVWRRSGILRSHKGYHRGKQIQPEALLRLPPVASPSCRAGPQG
jgi:hypothetical protein